jgi:cystatin-A/B
MSCGGLSSIKPASDAIRTLCIKLRGELENKAAKNFAECSAISFKSQVVAGTIYFVKIHIGNEEYMHARICEPLPCSGKSPEVNGVQMHKSKDDPIEYFG